MPLLLATLARLSLSQILFASGALVLCVLHLSAMALFGWPSAPKGIPPSVSIVHGFQWGLAGFALLLVGGILIGPYGGRTVGQIMKIGACFPYGAFFAHALFDYRFGGDVVDAVLYGSSAALFVWFAVFVCDKTMTE